MARYLSGRSKTRPQSQLRDDRNRYLSIDQAEPNLGDPSLTDVEASLPPGPIYQIVSVIGNPGERYWVPRQGGLIPGSITVYDEDVIIPNNAGVSSITQLTFKGAAIRAEGYLNLDGSPGVGATITVFAPGSQGQFIINNSNEFTGVTSFFYDVSNNRIGVATNAPTQLFDVNGNIRLRGELYDWNNSPGATGNLLVKNSDNGVSWVPSVTLVTGAGGTFGQIQFHGNTGLVDGADVFYYDFVNNRVGIGSTLPKYLFDVSGISTFSGTTYIDNLNVTSLDVTGFSTFTQLLDANGGATIDNVRIGVGGDNEIDTSSGNLTLDSSGGNVIVDDNLNVVGVTSVGFITAKDAYVGILTATNLTINNTNLTNLLVTGIATIATGIVTNLRVTGVATGTNLDVTNLLDVSGNANFQKQSTFNNLRVSGVSTLGNLTFSGNTVGSTSGNLILNSAGIVQSEDRVSITDTTESTTLTNGSFITAGGIGVSKNVNIGGNLLVQGTTTLSSLGGITTTGGDLYVGGDLYLSDDIVIDDVNANTGTFKIYLTTKDFNATGISTVFSLTATSLDVTGFSTFTQLLDANGGATIDNVRIGVGGDNEIDTSSGNLTLDSSGGNVIVDDNLNVTGNSTFTGIATFNSNLTLGNEETDTVTFTSRVNSNVLPSTSGTLNLGSDSLKWDNIYANTFVGKIIGNADSATKLANSKNFSITGDVEAPAIAFDGTADVTLNAILDNTGVAADTYGSSTTVPRITVDSKGRITSATNVGIAFSTATVFQSDNIKTISSGAVNPHFLTFVDSNNTSANYEALYTAAGITYVPSTNSLSLLGNLTVSGIATFNSNVTLGNEETDTITFNSRVNSNVLPSTNGTLDLGSTSLKWDEVHANKFIGEFVGNVDGNAESATKLQASKNFSIIGDVDAPAIAFDGTNDVELVATLDATGVIANTYGSDVTVPQITVDSKGRITSAVNVGVNFAAATVLNSDNIKTIVSNSTDPHFLTFVDSNNTTEDYEALYTAAGITYVPSTSSLSVTGNLTASGTATFNGNVTLGNEETDTVTFTSRVNSNILPSTSGTLNLGSDPLKWDNIYANTFVGTVTGNAESATKLANSKNFSITGDVSAAAIAFDGTADVTLNAILDTTGVTANTYGSSTEIPSITVDDKGRITSATTVAVSPPPATDNTPVGTVIFYAGATPPTSYLTCNGAAVSRITYSALFAVIGTLYGVGDGTTTFNLPNLTERMPIGKGGPGYNISDTGGAKTVTLTVNQIPSHSHPISLTAPVSGTVTLSGNTPNSGGHSHTYTESNSSNVPKAAGDVLANRGTFTANTGGTGNHSHPVTVSGSVSISASVSGSTVAQGGSGAHENMPPYIALTACIKYQ